MCRPLSASAERSTNSFDRQSISRRAGRNSLQLQLFTGTRTFSVPIFQTNLWPSASSGGRKN
jgi:hypothetical protein